MSRPLVLGLGNRCRGDDGAGPAVLDELRRRSAPLELVAIADATDLFDCLSPLRTTVVVDAALAQGAPGRVWTLALQHFVELAPCDPDGGLRLASASSHALSVEAVLASAQVLGLLPMAGTLVAVEGQDFALGNGLSLPVEAALARAADEVLAATLGPVLD